MDSSIGMAAAAAAIVAGSRQIKAHWTMEALNDIHPSPNRIGEVVSDMDGASHTWNGTEWLATETFKKERIAILGTDERENLIQVSAKLKALGFDAEAKILGQLLDGVRVAGDGEQSSGLEAELIRAMTAEIQSEIDEDIVKSLLDCATDTMIQKPGIDLIWTSGKT